jgi:hypothetical protein
MVLQLDIPLVLVLNGKIFQWKFKLLNKDVYFLLGEYRDPNQPISTQETAGSNAQPLYGRYNTDRCNLYEKEFLICLDNTNRDSKQCQGFWEALKGSFIIYIPGGS